MSSSDTHLSSEELDLAADQPRDFAASERGAHLDDCETCRRSVAELQAAQRELDMIRFASPPPIEEACPAPEQWVRYSLGQVTPKERQSLLAHAAGCGRCSQVMAELAVNEEEASGEGLEWDEDKIRAVGKELARKPPSPSPWRRLIDKVRLWPLINPWPAAAAATAMAVLVVGTVSWQKGLFEPRPPFPLLARAATESPVSELRFPGAAYGGEVRRNRGSESGLAAPESLLEAEVKISRGLKKHPNQPDWLRAKAQAEYLRGDLDAARETLDKGLDLAPDATDLQQDLAMVWFESAERHNEAADYAKAIELFSEVLKARPRDAVARFNRALAYEKLPAPHQALEDWQEFLRLEPSGAYADQARQHIAKLQKDIQQNGRGAALEPGDPGVMELLEKAYATAPGDAESRAELARLAIRFQKDYGDLWLSELLAGAGSARAAVSELCQAFRSNRGSDPASAVAHGRTALQLFQRSGSAAGQARAKFEIAYGFQHALDAREFLQESRLLVATTPGDRYPWVAVQANLELATACWASERLEEGDRYAEAALAAACRHRLSSLQLRAVGFRTTRLSATGAWEEAFRIGHDGLTLFWSGAYSRVRGEQLYASLSLAAESLHFERLAEALIREEIALPQRADPQWEGVERSRLGQFALMAGEPAAAQEQFEACLRLFRQLPANEANERYRAYAVVGMARAETRMGRSAAALSHLREVEKTMLGIGAESLPALYYLALGEAQQAAGQFGPAEASLEKEVGYGQELLATLKQESDRSRWAVDLDEPYRSVVRLELDGGRPEAALAVWEWYRLARWGVRSVPHLSLAKSDLKKGECESAPGFVVSYLSFEDGIAVWTCDRGKMSYRWLNVPERDLGRLARRFASICSDPRSDTADLHRIGGEIYRILVAPVIASWRESEPVYLELDGPSLLIPFEAIPTPSGDYLGDRFVFALSPGRLYASDKQIAPGRSGHVLAVADPALNADLARQFGPLHEAREEAAIAASLYPSSTMLTGQMANSSAIRRELSSATVFHYGGHAIATPEQNGLLVSDGLWSAANLLDQDLNHCSLVVLAACSTGQLDSDPLFGPASLVRSFVVAGARQVVASRWAVDSRATRVLMETFYRELRNGRSATWAMHSAAQRIRQELRLDRPYYWAAYCVFGARDAPV